jgi:hypothetical protein
MPRGTINFDTVRKIGLALPGVEESTAYGSPALNGLQPQKYWSGGQGGMDRAKCLTYQDRTSLILLVLFLSPR